MPRIAFRRPVTAAALGTLLAPGMVTAEPDVARLLERIGELEARVRYLENRDPQQVSSPVPLDQEGSRAVAVVEENLDDAVPGSEREVLAVAPEQEPKVDIGGALRFNLVHRDFSRSSESKLGESGLDVFRLNVDGQLENLLISAEYRHYSYMDTLHHGWVGYEFEDASRIQFGIHRVPFGLLPYAAHNAWFGVPYYVGLADDYDMGVKYVRQDGPWNAQLAFYKNEELNDPTDAGRYSLDLLRGGEQQNEEINQFNARLAHTLGQGTGCENEVGVSAQVSEIYNAATDDSGEHRAAAVHLDSRCGRWNLQLQGVHYDYDPANPAGVSDDSVQLGAFTGTYEIAGRGQILVANLAYNFESSWDGIQQITCYNDYSRLFKDIGGAGDSQINTLGCAIGAGPLFTYLDWIYARDMAFFGAGSMAAGGDGEWHSRININVGYYW